MATNPVWVQQYLNPNTTTKFVQNAVTNGIASNQNKGELAVERVSDLTDQIGQLLDTIADAQQISVTVETPTTVIDLFANPDVPIAPTINAFPVMGDLLTVDANFPIQNEYFSDLTEQLKSTLFDLVLNIESTGLNPDIEQQIWDRARERTTETMQGAIDNIRRMHARSGWEVATGDEVAMINKAIETKAIADVTESRSIAIAQAELEQKNLQFSVSQSVIFEGLMINLFNAFQQRLVDSEKARIESLNAINTNLADVFKSETQGAAAQSGALTDIYKGDVTAYSAIVSASAEKTKAQVSHYEQEVNYITKKQSVYIEQIKANLATFLGQKELTLGTLKTVAQLWSQLAASFGSAVNYNAGISAGETNSTSMNNTQSNTSSFNISDSTTHSD